ncbi:MAG: hypothetical protein FD138_2258 [Planctomycetota bacterium]|nr:MAG: hypothetical protein FD138_2258 [Planctomycetota bacterium]
MPRVVLLLFSLLLLNSSATQATDPSNARRPKDDAELRYWLENMIWHHRFSNDEITASTGLSVDEIKATRMKFEIRDDNRPAHAANAPLRVLPYPGGRHPRIGFLDGAVNPQRETKVSVFTPWDQASYVVVDVPEALWSNLGLTYLAHTHIDTVWSKQGIAMERLEWNRRKDGSLDIQRRLPNGIEFGALVAPQPAAVRMELWLKNGSKEKLSDLRVQNCVMLKGASGFAAQTNDNKLFRKPFVAVHDDSKKRWIITAWEPCHRPWGNAPCPCLHSDPKFPDCAPGETQTLRGWLSFYEGTDIDAELERIKSLGWQAEPLRK